MIDLLTDLLTPQPVAEGDDLSEWLRDARNAFTGPSSELDRTLRLAARAPTPAFAAAAAHQGALHHLLPVLPVSAVAAFCVSEDHGPHPRHILSTLSAPAAGAHTEGGGAHDRELLGHKRWATLAPISDLLVVVASTGWVDGVNRLRAVTVPADRSGVVIEPLPTGVSGAGLPHALLHFDDVAVSAAELLPGDAYTALVKPFRLLEDLFGAASSEAVAMAVGLRHGWPQADLEHSCAVILGLRALLDFDPQAPSTHIAVAGALDQASQARRQRLPLWDRLPDDVSKIWRPADEGSAVGESARQRRRETAWARLGGLG